jgi:hypothetical protein
MDVETAKALAGVSYDRKNAELPDGYQIDHQLTNKNQTVVFNQKTKQVAVSFRGTSKGRDVLSDVAVLKGYQIVDPRFRNSSKVINDTKNKYPGYQVVTTSHSLGGNIAEYAVRHSKHKDEVEIYNFNKGAGFSDIGIKRNKNQHDYRTEDDIVSTLSVTQRGGKNTTVKTKKGKRGILSGHKLKNMFV